MPKRKKIKAVTSPSKKIKHVDVSSEDIEDVYEKLTGRYGIIKRRKRESTNACGRKKTILNACFSLILSQNTSDKNSRRALKSLNETFSTAEEMETEGQEKVENAIKCGGLAKMKSTRIMKLLRAVREKYGELSLEHLREANTDQARQELSALPGLGPKSVACILLFTLERDEFPVDTHVWRVGKRLGWTPENSSRENSHVILNRVVPTRLFYELHILMIKHGKKVCKARNPKCESCLLKGQCPHAMRELKHSE